MVLGHHRRQPRWFLRCHYHRWHRWVGYRVTA